MISATAWWENLHQYVGESFFGIPAGNYLFAFLILLVALLCSRIFSYIILRYVLKFAKNTRYQFDQLLVESLRRPLSWGFILLGVLGATLWFTRPAPVDAQQSQLEALQKTIRRDFEKAPRPQDPRYFDWLRLDNEKTELEEALADLETAVAAANKAVADKEAFIQDTYPVVPDEETPEHAAYSGQTAELETLKEAAKAQAADLQAKKARSGELTAQLKNEFEVKPAEGDPRYEEYEKRVAQESKMQARLRLSRGANVWLGRILGFMTRVLKATGAVWAFWILYNLIDILSFYLARMAQRTGGKLDDQLVPLIRKSLRVFVVFMAVLVAFQNLGYSLTSVLAGLGLGGLAFALAAQDTIGNFFGSLTVILDRPFQVGDWIKVGDSEGTVEEVGFRSTRIRTFYDSQIVIPNSEMANATIDNLGRRRYRRKSLTLGVTYDTPPQRIEAFCEGIRELIRLLPYMRKDYFHVYFNNYGAYSLDVLMYVFVQAPDWGTELREWHRLFLCIARLAEKLGVEFAFPTQTLHLANGATPAPGATAPAAQAGSNDAGDFQAAHETGRAAAREVYAEMAGDRLNDVPPPVDLANNDSVLATYFGAPVPAKS